MTEPKAAASAEELAFWLAEHSRPQRNSSFTLVHLLSLEGDIDLDRLEAAAHAVVGAQRNLGKRYAFSDGTLRVTIGPPPPIVRRKLPRHGVRPFAEECRSLVFDTASGPLAEITVVELSDAAGAAIVLAAHHLVFDGESRSVLERQLCAAYVNGNSQARTERLPPPEVEGRAASGSAGRRPRAAGQKDFEAALGYWNKTARRTDILTPRVAEPTPGNGSVAYSMSEDALAAVGSAATMYGVSSFVILIAAWSVVLNRYGNTDVVVGIPVSVREVEDSDVIGCFVAELPLNLGIESDLTISGAVKTMEARVREMLLHRRVPVVRVVDQLRLSGSLPALSGGELFSSGVSFRRATAAPSWGAGVIARRLELPGSASRSPLVLQLVEREQCTEGMLSWQAGKTSDGSARTMLDHLEVALVHLGTMNDGLIADMPLGAPVVAGAAAPQLKGLLRGLVRDGIRQACELYPDRVALKLGNKTLTFKQLRDRAATIASQFALFVRPGDRVAVLMSRCLDLVPTLLAVHWVGGVYVPLDPDYPEARLLYILEDAAPVVIATNGPLLFQASVPVVDVSSIATFEQGRGEVEPVPLDGAAAAYLIYTSGSTGTPKGVMVPQSALANVVYWAAHVIGLGAEDAWLSVTSPSFDIAALEYFAPLVSGSRVVLAPPAVVVSGRQLARLIEAETISVLQATPATWKLLASSGWSGSRYLVALCGGEALPDWLASYLATHTRRAINVYGPTETTIWSTAWEITAGPVKIGLPIWQTTVRVVDDLGRRAPTGVAGELQIGGAGIAMGYWNRPGLTRERFISCPDQDGHRLYRTGDIVRMDGDGALSCLGRNDDQVKVRGYRVELGDVNAQIMKSGLAKDCAVINKSDAYSGDELWAFVVPASGEPGWQDQLKEALRLRLPSYMIPHRIVGLDSLPLTVNGKVDRPALLGLIDRTGWVAPRKVLSHSEAGARSSVTAEVVAGIWIACLGDAMVAREDGFFDLGGTSLAAASVSERVSDLFGVEIPVQLLYRYARFEDYLSEVARLVSRAQIGAD